MATRLISVGIDQSAFSRILYIDGIIPYVLFGEWFDFTQNNYFEIHLFFLRCSIFKKIYLSI